MKAFGLRFFAPVGVAAGVDPLGSIGRRFGRLGFGFAEVGTVVPGHQTGRVGVDDLRRSLERSQAELSPLDRATVLGAVVAPLSGSAPADAAQDVAFCVNELSGLVDYITVTLCGRRGAPRWDLAAALLLLARVARWRERRAGETLPLLVKVPGGMDVRLLAGAAASLGFAGLVVENGTELDLAQGGQRLPVVAVGGVRNAGDVARRLAAGAVLVQACRALATWGPLAAGRLCPR